MLNIPAAINIRLRADDHQPERSTGSGVITSCVVVVLGRGGQALFTDTLGVVVW